MLTYPYREGQSVTYHGRHAALRNRTWRVWLCRCRHAHPVEDPRLMLEDPDAGRVLAWHVRPAHLQYEVTR